MKAIITDKQQKELLKLQALNRMTRTSLALKIGVSRSTMQIILDEATPFAVHSKTFTAVNNFLIEELSNK